MGGVPVNIIQLDGTPPPDQPHGQDEWFKSLPRPGPNVSRPIRWFPRELRRHDENKECYEPLALSIGPYHQKKRHLEPMQNMKAIYASKYIQSKGSTFGQLYGKVERVAADARNCYTEDATLDDMSDLDFTRMMFLDGCFLLQFISDEVDLGRTMASVWQDLLLLENQLPFIVLMELEGPEKYNNLITKMKMFFQIVVGYTPKQGTRSSPSRQPIHLLHLLHAYLTGNMVRPERGDDERGDDEPWHWHTFRSVKELKEAGIGFRASRSHRFFSDVRFRSCKIWGGKLELPTMFIHGGTKSILLNLVAFEMCYQDMLTTETPDVASYVCFLDHLIDRPEDVKELRSKGILKNFTGSDQEVADLFNTITHNFSQSQMAYKKVYLQIERHHKNRIKMWLVELIDTYFEGPWSVISLVAGAIALALTFVDTYFEVRTYFSYLHHNNSTQRP